MIAKVEEKSTDSAIAVAGHPLHAMAVHFPIALMICTLGVDLIYWCGGRSVQARGISPRATCSAAGAGPKRSTVRYVRRAAFLLGGLTKVPEPMEADPTDLDDRSQDEPTVTP
ncbi:hypothetical protein DPM13_16305 [Paracoccus mutanolyticus]|uniref:DUF2231 domain-containing protein n=1 Tax=Paracoccus mutanolyticus TaxID=1499308 RepID=A0ABM6WTG5_9RHOB|nr:DUF2231 domain-containing protein [Paracoccus mutanolyticus]AWX93989.1 hypothetical protein DPM13_16305 [Paracoccus mutanolyticus]